MYPAIIAVKTALFMTTEYTSWVPFITTKLVTQDSLPEADYLLQNGLNPYVTSIMQKPLIIWALLQAPKIIYLLIDLLVCEVLSKSTSNEQYKKGIRVFYHLNPITFASLLALNTDGVDYLMLACSLYLIQRFPLLASIPFGVLLYLNPQYAIMIALYALYCRAKTPIFLILTSIVVAILVYLSYIITGDWSFVQKCYIDVYFPIDHRPTIGFLWALFSGLFTKYKLLYHALFMIFPLCYIIPFYNLFKKYSQDSMHFMAGVLMFTTFLYAQQITLMNLFMAFLFIFQRHTLITDHIIAFGALNTPLVLVPLSMALSYSWTNSSTGNPNFPFFQIFVSYIFFVAIVTESIRGMLKERTLAKLKSKQKTD